MDDFTPESQQQQREIESVISKPFLHLKTNRKYVVMGPCMIEATMQVGVLYVCVDDDSPDTVWVRPYSNFFDGRFKAVG